MSQMMSFAPMDADVEPAPSGTAAAVTLKRLGQRPLVFDGVELCMAMSYVPGAPMWFEINVFRTGAGAFVLCVKHFHRDEDERDISRAWECPDFETVMTTLETYDPAHDLRADVDVETAGMAPGDLAAKALAIRAQLGEARRQYASLVGEILHDLDQG